MQQSEQEVKSKYESAAKELEDALNAVTKTKEQDKRIQDAFGVYVKEVVAAAKWQMESNKSPLDSLATALGESMATKVLEERDAYRDAAKAFQALMFEHCKARGVVLSFEIPMMECLDKFKNVIGGAK